MNTVIEYPDTDSANPQYAGLSSRLKAFAFDFIIMFAYIIVLFGVTTGVIKAMDLLSQPLSLPENPLLGDAIAFITLILPLVLYFTLLESSPHQATWGKRKAGLRVVNADDGRLTRRQAFVRSLLKFLPWQVAHTSIFHIEVGHLRQLSHLPLYWPALFWYMCW